MMMEVKMQAAAMPPLTSDERESILQYLKRNAGTNSSLASGSGDARQPLHLTLRLA